MDWSVYARQHHFRHPVLEGTETVGIHAVFWSLVLGPFYFWKRGARIETMLFCLAAVPFYMFDANNSFVSYATVSEFSTVVWLASVLLAPILLTMSFHRRGWVETERAGAAESLDQRLAEYKRRRSRLYPTID